MTSNTQKQSTLSDLTGINKDNLYFYNQQKEEENNEINANTYRSIFYESCRGLEAWSVVCLDLDLFYKRKYDEEIAANYLSDDFLLTENDRRSKYAATWVLMALTRAIDTLYIHFDDPNSTLGKIFQQYVESID